jgi:uncharacterized membrane protein
MTYTFYNTLSPYLFGLNADGSVAVGKVFSGSGTYDLNGAGSFAGRSYALARSSSTGVQRLIGTQGANAEQGEATSVSDDGSVVVGWTAAGYLVGDRVLHGQRWVRSGGTYVATDIGSLSAGRDVRPVSVSRDGSAIAGKAIRADSTQAAIRWTAASGIVDLGSLPGGLGLNCNLGEFYCGDIAHAVSGDGLVVVGSSEVIPVQITVSPNVIGERSVIHPFRWTQAGGMVDLGPPPSQFVATSGAALATNNDGSVIVGYSVNRPFRWTARTGMQDLNTMLANAGFDTRGTTLTSATAISGDGKTIAGLANGEPYLLRFDDFTPG